MPIPPSAINANASSTAEILELQAIANVQFIEQSGQAMANAISQGLLFVTLTTFLNCNLTNLMNYYHGLGYQIALPDVHFLNGPDNTPYSLYGPDYYQWLTCNFALRQLQNPTRLRIMWTLPTGGAIPSMRTSAYTIIANNEVVSVDTTAGDVTISLPIQPNDGWTETITKDSIDGNSVIVSGNGNNIDGESSTISTAVNGESLTLIFLQAYGWRLF